MEVIYRVTNVALVTTVILGTLVVNNLGIEKD